MKIAVLGAGATGGLFGARLALAGEDVRLLDVPQAQIEAVRANGLTLIRDGEQRTVRLPIGRPETFEGAADCAGQDRRA